MQKQKPQCMKPNNRIKNTKMTHLRYLSSYLFILLITASWVKADNLWGKAKHQIKFKHLQVEQGLSSNVTSCILQDQQGFLWFGTDAGLNRYDGTEIKTYHCGNDGENGLSNGVIKCFYEDHKNNIWVGTERGLNRYSPVDEQFHYFLSNEKNIHSLSNNTITSITQDKNKDLWVGTFQGLNYLKGYNKDGQPEFMRIVHDPQDSKSLSNDRIYWLFTDKDGNLWIGTEGGGLNLLLAEDIKKGNISFTHFVYSPDNPNTISDNIVYSIFQKDDGNIYVGTDKGLSILQKQGNKFQIKNYLYTSTGGGNPSEIKIFSQIQDQQNRIWLATFGMGLTQFFPETGSFDAYQHQIYNNQSISRDFVYSVYSSREGILWLATRETGIDRIDPYIQRFIHLTHIPGQSSSLSNKIVKSITEGPDGRFWFGTYGGGLNVYNPKTNTFKYYKHSPTNKNSLSSNIIESIAFDHLNRLWIGTSKGLNLFDPKNEKFTRLEHIPNNKNSLTNNNIWSVLPAKDHSGIWIATYDGLDKYDWVKNKFYHFKNDPKNPTSLSFNYIRALLEDDNHNLWICTWGGGLDKLDQRKHTNLEKAEFEHFRHNPDDTTSISSDLVNTLFIDKNKRLWAGTQAGLNRLDPATRSFVQYSEKNGLADNVIKGILQDPKGMLWISTQKGMSKFNIKEDKFTNYFKKDGLQGNIFNLSSCIFNSKGEMMFGGNSGVTIFHPEKITERTDFPPVYFSNVKVNNHNLVPGTKLNGRIPLIKSLSSQSRIPLMYKENTLTIKFSAIEYSSPEKIKFAYRMDGVDKKWNITDYNNRQITYSSLEPGSYTFRVKTTNFCGDWNPKETIITFDIIPPFWATTLAYILYTLTLMSFLLYLGFILRNRIRIRQELQQEKEENQRRVELNQFKLQFFTNISHEIRTPLTLISLPLQKLIHEGDKLSSSQKQSYFKAIDGNVGILLRLVNQLLDFRKAENNKVKLRVEKAEICQLLKRYIESFTLTGQQKDIDIKFESQLEEYPAYADPRIMEKVFYNLLSNALKFTPQGGNINITLHPKGEISLPQDSEKQFEANDYFCISVKDSGVGIPQSELQNIFERFTQIQQTQDITAIGTGIGLALTKKLILAHKGFISVESIPEKGSTFYIWLPANNKNYSKDQIKDNNHSSLFIDKKIIEQSIPLEQIPSDNQINQKRANKKSQTLLIVEDNDQMRAYISDILAPHYNIVEATNGKEGLDKALAVGPDMVITDVMMPVMDGLELCRLLKKNVNISHIPVVMLTAKNTIEHQIEGLERGADQYISKPFKIEQLLLTVKNLLETRKNLQLQFSGIKIPEPKEVSVTSADEKFLSKMIETIETHISDPDFTVEALAQQIGLSSVHLYRKTKSLTGMAPNNFIRSFRLKRAAQLLKQNKLRISEVAYLVGFSDPKYFRKCFKTEFGKTPTEYTKNNSTTESSKQNNNTDPSSSG